MAELEGSALLQWYLDSGVDESVGDAPRDYFAETSAPVAQVSAAPAAAAMAAQETLPAAPISTPKPQASFVVPAAAASIAAARQLADQCKTLEELEAAVRNFEGCAIRRTAHNTVFSDGNPKAPIMIIGEAPGAQEDQQGIPFCGPSGKLLDKMLAAIGLDRTGVYITNTIFWRPPGNRPPSSEELAMCEPFVEKHIALIAPKLLVLAGGTATAAVMKRDQSISRLRGRFYEYRNPYLPNDIPAAVTFHPSYLLRSPQQKRLAWSDLRMIRTFIDSPVNSNS